MSVKIIYFVHGTTEDNSAKLCSGWKQAKLNELTTVCEIVSKDVDLSNKTLEQIATVLYNEPKEYQTILTHELSKGLSYPKARELALSQYFGTSKKYADILNNPNNILAIEYLIYSSLLFKSETFT